MKWSGAVRELFVSASTPRRSRDDPVQTLSRPLLERFTDASRILHEQFTNNSRIRSEAFPKNLWTQRGKTWTLSGPDVDFDLKLMGKRKQKCTSYFVKLQAIWQKNKAKNHSRLNKLFVRQPVNLDYQHEFLAHEVDRSMMHNIGI